MGAVLYWLGGLIMLIGFFLVSYWAWEDILGCPLAALGITKKVSTLVGMIVIGVGAWIWMLGKKPMKK